MNKDREYFSIKNFPEIDKIYTLNRLYSIVNKSNNQIDNKAYNDMITILKKYTTKNVDSFYKYYMLKWILNTYYDLSYKIISKLSEQDNIEIYNMYKFINHYTKTNIDFKITIINEFINLGIIEERNIQEHYTYNLYKKLLQILSIKYKNNKTKKPEELYDNSRASEIQTKAKKIVNYILKYNKESSLINQEHFIRPTNTTMEITCCLQDIIIDNEEDFKKFIDSLYKLFWENKVRKFAKNKELDFINDIRTYFYHDIEHGKSSDIRKKFKVVTDFYKNAIGKPIPKSTKNWQDIQTYIYDLIIDFLSKIEISEIITQ